AGAPTAAPALDQRGFSRAGAPDIGAYELGGTLALAPTNAGLSPTSGSSAALAPRVFTTKYYDPNGSPDLAQVYFLAGPSAAGPGALWCYYDARADRLYLRNNANTAWLGGFAPG